MSRSSIAASMTSSMEVQSVDGSAVPVRSLERSSRLSTSPASRSESSMIASRRSARSSSSIVGEVSASAAARIAVIGVRRSWETVRSRAVLISSLRRRASVSTVAPSRDSRSIAAASRASSAGHQRLSSRSRLSGSIPAGTTSVPRRLRSCVSGESEPPRLIRRPRRAAAPPKAARAPWRSARLPPERGVEARAAPSSVRASSAIRSASRRRASASCARLRASSASVLAIARRDEEGGQRHPVPRVRDREPPGRRDVEEVESQRR